MFFSPVFFVSYYLFHICCFAFLFIYLHFSWFLRFIVAIVRGGGEKMLKSLKTNGEIYIVYCIYIVVCGGGLNLFAAPAAKAAALAAGQELIALSVCQPEELGHKQQLKQSFPRNRSHTRKKYA